MTLIKPFLALSSGWALNPPIMIKLSYKLEKKSIIPVREFKKHVSESKGGLYTDINYLFFFSYWTQ